MSATQSSTHEEGPEDIHSVTPVHSFGANKFVENLAIRRSGQVLVTVHNTNELIEVDINAENSSRVVHRFANNLFGIVEVEEDVFYVSAGTIGQNGSFAIYTVDLSHSSAGVVGKLVDLPEALFLNGSCLLKPGGSIILVADSILGAVFAVDVQKETVKTWLQHTALKKVTENPNYPGVNGIKMHNGYLYLSNTEAKTFLRAGLTGAGDALGSIEVVYDRCNIDDFAFDAEGSVYLTSHIFNSVVKVRSNGVRSRITGGPYDTIVAGTTAVAFGRTPADRTRLYITTNGGMSNPVHGTVGPGRLLSLEAGYPEGLNHRLAKVLFVATSHDDLGNGTKTGVWLEEAAEPFIELSAQGFEIKIASPKGGAIPIDPRSEPTATQSTLWHSAIAELAGSIPLSEIVASKFDGIFLPGGHGPMFDLANNPQLASLIRDFHAQGKPIGAVCHGLAGLANVKLADGQYLVSGKEVTSYSWQEEVLAQLDKDVPFNLQQALTEHGGFYTAPIPRRSHVIVDGLLVTGQNPASSRETASAFGKVLNSYLANHHLPSATSTKFRIICHISTDPKSTPIRLGLRPKHYDFISANQANIVAGGPTIDSTETPTSMLLIIEAKSSEEAAAFIASEPYTASGKVFTSIDIQLWHQVIPGIIFYDLEKLK